MRENLSLVRSYSRKPAIDPKLKSSRRKFASVHDVVKQASSDFDGLLVITDKALKTAAESPYIHYGKTYTALQHLANLAHLYQERLTSLTSDQKRLGIRETLRDIGCGFKYAAHESELTVRLQYI